MFTLFRSEMLKAAKLDTLDRAFAIVEFSPTGEILRANAKFLDLMGYSEADLKGAHHRKLVEPAEVQSAAYATFWDSLGRGELVEGEFRRVRKSGEKVLVHGVYNPVRDKKSRVVSVLKVALNVTQERTAALEASAKIDAIGKMEGVIEFSPDSTILAINDVMLATYSYERAEVLGQPARMLVSPVDGMSPEYAQFWERLRAGESIGGLFQRLGKGGKPLLIKGSYNPIRDVNGRVCKIVALAHDLSDILVIGKGLEAVANGDLSRYIEVPVSSDFEKLKTDFNAAVEGMNGAIGSILKVTHFVGDAINQLAEASESLAQRTEEQAANLEEAAAALDEVSATVNFTSSNAASASGAVERTKKDAEKSGDVVGRAVDAMGRIETSSKEIGSIIGVVDEIAFQTNLLALNAGVEAARAGDAGRGFAVVAAEVRALAQRSTEAARQIKKLVSTSGADVANGVALVRETGDSLHLIVNQVGEMSELINQITTGAKEEATIVQEVNSSVTMVDEATQHNAAMAEETTAAIVSLKQQVETLLATAAQFKLAPDLHDPLMELAARAEDWAA